MPGKCTKVKVHTLTVKFHFTEPEVFVFNTLDPKEAIDYASDEYSMEYGKDASILLDKYDVTTEIVDG